MGPTNLIPPGFLHTEGSDIVAADGRRVRLAGVNWYGFECDAMVPGGLDVRTIDEICTTIADLGFNHIRLPYCDELVHTNPPVTEGLDAMPHLRGTRALDVMDAVIDGCRRHRLRVILCNHRSEAGWSAQGNGLWYSRRYTQHDWLTSLTTLTHRYRDDDTVVGHDLRNEPGAPAGDRREFPRNGGAVWGRARWHRRHPRDWAKAAETAGDAVLAINPDVLIVIEGVRTDPAGPRFRGRRHGYWPGGNLIGVLRRGGSRLRPRPIHLAVPGRLVYSVHDYGPAMFGEPPWCRQGTTAQTPGACREVWDQTWGNIVKQGIAPVYVGEFGTSSGAGGGEPQCTHTDINQDNPQGAWFTYLTDYINDLGVGWAIWALNGRFTRIAFKDFTDVETYGVLTPGYDAAASPSIMARLRPIQQPFAGGERASGRPAA